MLLIVESSFKLSDVRTKAYMRSAAGQFKKKEKGGRKDLLLLLGWWGISYVSHDVYRAVKSNGSCA
jgi:hypothetical protein